MTGPIILVRFSWIKSFLSGILQYLGKLEETAEVKNTRLTARRGFGKIGPVPRHGEGPA